MMEGVGDAGFDEDEQIEAEFDIEETEFAFGPRVKVGKGQKKRSNSFKLGSRPREVKDQVRKTYRRNSFHLKGEGIGSDEVIEEVKKEVAAVVVPENVIVKVVVT